MVSDLKSIGYKASLQAAGRPIQYPFVQNSDNHKWNVAWSAWYQDYPAASDFLNVLLGCGSSTRTATPARTSPAFCDKTIQAQMDQALTLGRHRPSGANKHLGAGRHAVTDQAPWVDLYNPKQIDFLSSGSTATSGARSGTSSSTSMWLK